MATERPEKQQQQQQANQSRSAASSVLLSTCIAIYPPVSHYLTASHTLSVTIWIRLRLCLASQTVCQALPQLQSIANHCSCTSECASVKREFGWARKTSTSSSAKLPIPIVDLQSRSTKNKQPHTILKLALPNAIIIIIPFFFFLPSSRESVRKLECLEAAASSASVVPC